MATTNGSESYVLAATAKSVDGQFTKRLSYFCKKKKEKLINLIKKKKRLSFSGVLRVCTRFIRFFLCFPGGLRFKYLKFLIHSFFHVGNYYIVATAQKVFETY